MATTTNFGWETPDDTDLVKDGAAAIRTLGQSIDTSMMDLEGGTTGQVLSKASNTDMDFTWVTTDDTNAIQNAIVDAKGDLIGASAADTPARLAVGSNGTVLTADSAEATGLKWAAPAGADLTRITKVTFTNSTAINIDNCFSSTYDFYMIQYKVTSSTTSQYIVAQMRSGGTNNTTANYSSTNVYSQYSGTTVAGDGIANSVSGRVGYTRTSDEFCGNLFVYNPFSAQYTTWANMTPDADYSQTFQGIHKVKTSYDGIAILPNAGNLTGELNIYGFKKG
jgi:hypothetical protein